MADTTPKKATILLKVMVHKAKNRAVYAEADCSFVDILFSFMTLPLATIVRILGKCPDQKIEALGSLKNLYQSLKDLPTNYLATDEGKHMLLNPRSSSSDICRKLKIKIDDTEPLNYFICSNFSCTRRSGAQFSIYDIAKCSCCGSLMSNELTNEDDVVTNIGGGCGVLVSDVTTFILTEDLRVFPNATCVIIQLLCDFGISDASQLEERNIDVGLEQILMFFKGALFLKYPLTFLVFPNSSLTQQDSNLQQGTSIQHVINKEIATTSKRMMLKVVLQKSTSKFLFAEAEEDFVDFVFGFLQIPLGTVVGKLMNGSSSLKNLDNLFASASDLKVGKHIKSQDLKEKLLQPQLEQNYLSQNNIFPLKVSNSPQIYCHSYKNYYNDTFAYMTHSIKNNGYKDERCDAFNLKDPRVQGGFIKASAKFMLTDDLVITPLSTFSTIFLLNKLKVPMHDVVEHELSIGIVEGLQILKASLNSSMKCLSPLAVALPKKNDIK